jgi:TPR repeat protein
MYVNGFGVAQDYGMAMQWYLMNADDSYNQFAIGELLASWIADRGRACYVGAARSRARGRKN